MLIWNISRIKWRMNYDWTQRFHSFFDWWVDIVYNFGSENSLATIYGCNGQKLYGAKIVWCKNCLITQSQSSFMYIFIGIGIACDTKPRFCWGCLFRYFCGFLQHIYRRWHIYSRFPNFLDIFWTPKPLRQRKLTVSYATEDAQANSLCYERCSGN